MAKKQDIFMIFAHKKYRYSDAISVFKTAFNKLYFFAVTHRDGKSLGILRPCENKKEEQST